MASSRRRTRSVRQSRLGFEAFLQRECVGGGAGETGQDLVVVQAADLAGRALDDDVAQGDRAIAAERDAERKRTRLTARPAA
ncbi:hypothetical protein G6F53_014259 [Rhizopus delemar]|nr:hypothetical protein G6F53_014259 [Rhizopus delemar]